VRARNGSVEHRRPAWMVARRSGPVRLAVLGLGATLVLMVGCSSNKATRQVEQNAKLWGQASCAIVEASSANDQQNAYGQTKQYSATAVQQVSSMQQGASQIDALNSKVNADKTAHNVTSYVPDLKAIQTAASGLAGGSSGDEQAGWNSLSGAVSDCVAQLPPNLQ
jgi:hypothetical protein